MSTVKYVIQEKEEQAHIRGTATGVSEQEAQPVDGIYDVSTIRIGVDHTSRLETVAFKVSGIGPNQIAEPYSVPTLDFRAARL